MLKRFFLPVDNIQKACRKQKSFSKYVFIEGGIGVMHKTFVLDTNVLLHNPSAIEAFEDNTVVLPMMVIEELDKFKTHNDERGRNSRQVIRRLDALRARGNLGHGVRMDNEGILKIVVGKHTLPDTGLEDSYADNRILAVAHSLHHKGERVIFVSKDINARIKADALGIEAQDFESQKVNFSELYTGFREIHLPGSIIDAFYREQGAVIGGELYPNEFVLMIDEGNDKHTALGRVVDPHRVVPLSPRSEHVWNIKPRSKEQRMALELLLDPSVLLVTLVGPAGTGKTLLAIAAALETTQKHNLYEKILVSRPIIPMGRDIGYLPGAKEQKLSHWMQPIFDNLMYLMTDGPQDAVSSARRVEELMEDDVIELEALTYIRGRSIPHQYIIVDEAQNLTPHEVKTIVSRAGEGTKMVLTGDPEQIDNPYLDCASNGLSYAVERMKELSLSGHVSLRKSERSTLAAAAADLL